MAIRARTNRTDDHKRYLLLLTFFLIEAAASRIKWLPGMSSDAYWYIFQYLYLDLFLVILVIYDLRVAGRLARATKVGLIVFLLYQLVVIAVWDSETWSYIAAQLLLFLSPT